MTLLWVGTPQKDLEGPGRRVSKAVPSTSLREDLWVTRPHELTMYIRTVWPGEEGVTEGSNQCAQHLLISYHPQTSCGPVTPMTGADPE